MLISSPNRRRFSPLPAALLLAGLVCLILSGCVNPSLPAGTEPVAPEITGPVAPPSTAPQDQPSTAELSVHFIDVGQGDAILILAHPGQTVLIDGGPREAGPAVVAYLGEQGVVSLDLVIATHPHADHIGGLIDVLATMPVGRVIDSGMPHTTKTFDDYLQQVERQVEAGHCVYEIPAGQVIALAGNVTLTVLGPERPMGSLNNSSVVARLDFDQTSFLFTGDAEAEAEAALAGKRLSADVLKVGHHGSSSSTTETFLAAVAPRYAVISTGAGNTYGHPHQVVLDRLAAVGAAIYRTDHHGHIVFTSDGTVVHTGQPAGVAPGRLVGSINSDRYHLRAARHLQAPR